MSKEKLHIPQADMLMGSMRSMGYSFETALADVIDNSISADAKSIKVLFPNSPFERAAVGILDDGNGMPKDKLLEAMRYGSTSSEDVRAINDLGRFGLGLKSASLSQCRMLTAVSYWDGKVAAYRWDYNYILQTKAWYVLSLTQAEIAELPYFDQLKVQKRGTLIIWEDFDILSKANDGQVYDALNDLKEVVANHLSLIFHRYMSRSRHKVVMYVNNQKLKPKDPFLESHAKTTIRKERTIAIQDSHGKEQLIRIRPFILPYLSDMTEHDKKLMGGVEDMRSKQGFYVYRNERLIIWGNWFGMSRRNELTKNARIRVDIPNALDDIWSIDVKKQVATIPKRIQNQLRKMVEEALGVSVTKHTHRGRRNNPDDNIDYIWERIEGRGDKFFYQVNRDSELMKYIMRQIGEENATYIDMLISELEQAIPLGQIYLDKANGCADVKPEDNRADEVYEMAITMVDSIKGASKLPLETLIDNLMHSQPFCDFTDLKVKLIQYYNHEND